MINQNVALETLWETCWQLTRCVQHVHTCVAVIRVTRRCVGDISRSCHFELSFRDKACAENVEVVFCKQTTLSGGKLSYGLHNRREESG